jgi:hypothetical protein
MLGSNALLISLCSGSACRSMTGSIHGPRSSGRAAARGVGRDELLRQQRLDDSLRWPRRARPGRSRPGHCDRNLLDGCAILEHLDHGPTRRVQPIEVLRLQIEQHGPVVDDGGDDVWLETQWFRRELRSEHGLDLHK